MRVIKRARSIKNSPGVISSHVAFILQRLPPYPPDAHRASTSALLETYRVGRAVIDLACLSRRVVMMRSCSFLACHLWL